MWSTLMIAQAIGWLVLTLSSPLIFIFLRKAIRHMSYVFFPRDTLIQYQHGNLVTEAYYVKHSFLKGSSFRRLSGEEIKNLEPTQ